MTWRVADDEYRRIKDSWKNAPEPMPRSPRDMWQRIQTQSPRDNWERCQHNVREAAQRERDLRQLASRLPPGDTRLVGDKETPSLGAQILTAVSDQKHWRGYAEHYWSEMQREEGQR